MVISPWFSVGYRNPGHWDISSDGGRWFRIRGNPGDVTVHDERPEGPPRPREPLHFKTVATAFVWIADQFMTKPDGAPL
jgi:hypothetical protein